MWPRSITPCATVDRGSPRAGSARWATGCRRDGRRLGNPQRTVLLVTGDGSFQMTLQELATCVAENLDVKVVIMNNGCLAMVRQWQELFYSRRYSEVGMSYFRIS